MSQKIKNKMELHNSLQHNTTLKKTNSTLNNSKHTVSEEPGLFSILN